MEISMYMMISLVILLCLLPVGTTKVMSITYCQTSLQNIKCALIFAVLGLFASFRGPLVGNDTTEYLKLYTDISSVSFSDLYVNYAWRFEMGYIYLNKILSCIFSSPNTVIIFTSIFTYFVVYKFVKQYSPFVGLSILLFFLLRYHDTYMNVVRQAMAMAICLLGYMQLKKSKNIFFFLLIMLAISMHKSSFVFFLFYFWRKVEFKIDYIKLFPILCVLIYWGSAMIVNFMLDIGIIPSYYEDSDYFEEGKIAPLINFLRSTLVFIVFVLPKAYYQPTAKLQIGSDLAWILMIGSLFHLVSLSFANLSRVAEYFSFFEIIAIPYAMNKMQTKNRLIFLLLLVAICIIYYVVIQLYRPDWNYVYPYVTFLN